MKIIKARIDVLPPGQAKQILIEAVDGLNLQEIKPLSVLSYSLNC